MLDDILKLVSRLPPEALALLAKLVRTLLTSKDPESALRRATAAASEQGSEAALKKLLGRRG